MDSLSVYFFKSFLWPFCVSKPMNPRFGNQLMVIKLTNAFSLIKPRVVRHWRVHERWSTESVLWPLIQAIEALIKVQKRLMEFSLGFDPILFLIVKSSDPSQVHFSDQIKDWKCSTAIDQWKLLIILFVGQKI